MEKVTLDELVNYIIENNKNKNKNKKTIELSESYSDDEEEEIFKKPLEYLTKKI